MRESKSRAVTRLGDTPIKSKTGLFGADDGGRTHDINLGKVTLYQLSYIRVNLATPPENDSG